MTVATRQVSGFSQVRFRGPGILKISQGDREGLTIHAPSYVMDRIEADVVGDELRLGYRSPKVISLRVHKEVISYSLSVRDLNRVRAAGMGRVLIPDLDTDALRIDLSGMGQVILDHLTADRLDVYLSGAGMVSARGDVESQSIKISGTGHYKAQHLISDFARAEISGAGLADVTVSENLDAIISGAGQISYEGYPEISRVISGAGRLVRRRRKSRQPVNGEDHG